MKFSHKQTNEIRAACQRFNVRLLYVFGSYVSGLFTEESDIDFMVEFVRDGFTGAFEQYSDFKEELRSIVHRKVDLVCIDSIKNPLFRQNAEAEREMVYAA